jgi:soluble lytic murein transglycosylase-like protein
MKVRWGKLLRQPRIYIPLATLFTFAVLIVFTVFIRLAAMRRTINVWDVVQERAAAAGVWQFEMLSPNEVADLLVESIIQLESGGNPRLVGAAGERGLMQIMPETWADMTQQDRGVPLSFERAFDPALNERVGRLYLAYLQAFLHEHRELWQSDERALLLACYNGGPGRVRDTGFDVRKLPQSVQSYVERGSALHDSLLAEQRNHFRHTLNSQLMQNAAIAGAAD